MKKLHTAKLLLCAAIVSASTCFFPSALQAQTFNPPSAFESTYPGVGPDIALTSHTSAYSWPHCNTVLGGYEIYLAGWDDVNGLMPSRVSWQLTFPGMPSMVFAQGILPYTGVRDLEVGFLNVGGDPQILVAYHETGVGHKLDVYSIASGSPTLLYTNTLSAIPNYTRISMDCHLEYAVAIAWETPAGIRTIMGNNTPGSITFSPILSLNATTGETTVDCAFTHGGGLNVQYVYYNPNTGNITESQFDYWVAMALPSPSVITPTINDLNLVGTCQPCGTAGTTGIPIVQVCPYPNIDGLGHGPDNWAYTYTTDNQNISVRLHDIPTSTLTTVIVNDGSAWGTPAINTVPNRHPFCVYNMCGSIIVAWHTNAIDWAGTGAVAGYVGLSMSLDGTVLMSSPDYLTVANNPTWASQTPVLSMSKQDDVNQFTYTIFPEWDPGAAGYRMENKFPPICTNSFKGNPNEKTETHVQCNDRDRLAEFHYLHGKASVQAYPNPFTNTFKVALPTSMMGEKGDYTVVDALGATVMQFNGTAAEANIYLNSRTKSLAAGTYFINVNVAGRLKESVKVVKAE
ncbi:MAG: T9SS type A sorting domain-containing protein [Flavipsychrobacter sp.]|nr:T9SS type A sorting domain-containing protein [Flavipsychrobacter sp.]